MMTAMLVAAVLMADGGTSSEMFNAQKDRLTTNAIEKLAAVDAGVKAVELPGFAGAVKGHAEKLAVLFTEKLALKTTVKSILVSEGGADEPDMAVITFKNSKETFALVLVGIKGEIKVLPRDFKEL